MNLRDKLKVYLQRFSERSLTEEELLECEKSLVYLGSAIARFELLKQRRGVYDKKKVIMLLILGAYRPPGRASPVLDLIIPSEMNPLKVLGK